MIFVDHFFSEMRNTNVGNRSIYALAFARLYVVVRVSAKTTLAEGGYDV